MAGVYSSIDGDRAFFRLLTLHPAPRDGDDIECSVKVTPLAQPPEYEALSYVWGDPTITKKVCCNGVVMNVTENLSDALRTLRRADQPRVLWVDALCINQADLGERAAQVTLMCDIYQKAELVIIWLGNEGDGSNEALSMCERLVNYRVRVLAHPEVKAGMDPFLWAADRSKIRQILANIRAADGEQGNDYSEDLDPTEREISAISTLLKRPWFSRCWVLQELCVGRETKVQCGSREIPWQTLFCGFLLTMLFHGTLLAGRPDHLTSRGILRMSTLWSPIHARLDSDADVLPMKDLLGLLWSTLAFDATDARDKVYSLLGMVDTEQPVEVVPNYYITNTQCFHRTAKAILKQTKTLDIMLTSHKTSRDVPLVDLPSWAPDWTGRVRNSPTSILFQEDRDNSLFSACGNSLSYDPVFANERTLVVSGFVWDRIAALENVLCLDQPKETIDPAKLRDAGFRETMSTMATYSAHAFSGAGEYFELLVRWEHFALSQKSYPTGEDPLHAYVSTLCFGNTPGGTQARVDQYHKWSACLSGPRKLSMLRYLGARGSFYNIAMGFSATMFSMRQEARKAKVRTDGGVDRTFATVTERTLYRRLARTGGGYLGVVPAKAEVGDAIVLCKGGRVPFILRQASEKTWALVGPAYVHGIMAGEAWDLELCKELHLV